MTRWEKHTKDVEQIFAKHKKAVEKKQQLKAERLTRAKTMQALRDKGMTLQQIANEYGLTRERVRQILLKEKTPEGV